MPRYSPLRGARSPGLRWFNWTRRSLEKSWINGEIVVLVEPGSQAGGLIFGTQKSIKKRQFR